jgi:predicted NBD/HSP70 family sugar kinase
LDKNIVIGVDLGGTKIMSGAVDTNGNISANLLLFRLAETIRKK